MTTADEFLMSGGAASAKFPTVGTTVTGTISAEPEVRQQTDIQTGTPKTWPDGKPRMQLVVTLATAERDPANPDDDGERSVYIKGNMQKAVRDAVRKAGASGLKVGGVLSVTYSGDGQSKGAGFNPPKLFTATYTPPANTEASDFLNGPAESEPAPAPAQPAAPGLSPEQLAAIAALTPEQKAQLGIQ